MSKLPYKIQIVQDELNKLSTSKNFEQAQRVILSVIKLLDDSVSENDLNLFQLFNDSDGKIRANATWFFEDQVMADRKATYKVHADNKLNLDFKVYGVNKASKRVVAWATALTPNFEDEPFNSKFNVGVDFIVPKSTDRVIIVLTNNYVIRTLELKGNLTVTFQEILSKWSDIKEYSNKTLVHNILWESFDLQPLNKKFYAGISERFITLRQHLLKENILDEKHSSMFANRLLGRVIFTWFVDKKGIINPDLKYFDSQSFDDDSEYYRTKLERLFFGVLNTPTDEREYKDDITPFLNGGLFEVRQNDLYKNSKLTFPKNYFDDLFKFLSEYNFTTDESTSQFQQVAIDPEMLGRIFENLLAEITEETGEQARKAKGAFYTPREIVDYMCKESLKEYLKSKLPEDTYKDQRLYQLIDAPDKDFQDQDHNWRRDWKPYKDTIISALDDLKVLDPACGSGAFPIGMLQLLVRVYERLEPRFDGYKAKLQIIEKNIYGVDIEPMAVEIARLRTWLSIIVDEESDSKKIKPLPNLEFKFVCANSLIELDKSGATSFWDDSELENKLQVLRDAYFNTESLNKKKKLRSDYDLLVNTGPTMFGDSEKTLQLKTYRPFDNESSASFFSPEFMFGVKFFDLVVGNPPYVQIKQIPVSDRRFFEENYKSAIGRFNLFYLFIELTSKLVKESGLTSFIVPDRLLLNTQCKDLRAWLLNAQTITEIVEFSSSVFDSAVVDSIILSYKNKPRILDFVRVKTNVVIKNLSEKKAEKIEIKHFNNSASFQFDLNSDPELENLIEKIKKQSVALGEISDTKDGIIQSKIPDVLFLKKPIDSDSKKLLFGRDVNKFEIIFNDNWVNYKIEEMKKVELSRSGGGLRMRNKEIFEREKILTRQTADRIIGCIDSSNYYYSNTLHGTAITDDGYDIRYVLGILNSSLMSFYYKKITNEGGKVFAQVKIEILRTLPIKKLQKKEQELIIDLVRGLENSELKSGTENLDNAVMDLYNLTDKEKEIVRSGIK